MPSLWWGAPVCNTITQRANEGWLKWRESLTTGSWCDQSGRVIWSEGGAAGLWLDESDHVTWILTRDWLPGEEREVRARHLNEAPRCEVCDTQYFSTTNSIIPLCIPHCFHFVLSKKEALQLTQGPGSNPEVHFVYNEGISYFELMFGPLGLLIWSKSNEANFNQNNPISWDIRHPPSTSPPVRPGPNIVQDYETTSNTWYRIKSTLWFSFLKMNWPTHSKTAVGLLLEDIILNAH